MPRATTRTGRGDVPPAVGIDIGTCYARVAVLDGDGPRLVADRYGDRPVPAVVRYGMHGSDVGYYPERFLVTDWENTVREVPRFLGRYADLPRRVIEAAPFPVYEEAGRARFNLLYTTTGPEEVYTRLVRHLAGLASADLGLPVCAVALTVPANAEDRVRVSVQAALAAAGSTWYASSMRPRRRCWPCAGCCPATPGCATAWWPWSISAAARPMCPSPGWTSAGVTILATAGDPYLGGVELRARLAAGVTPASGGGRRLTDPRRGGHRPQPGGRTGAPACGGRGDDHAEHRNAGAICCWTMARALVAISGRGSRARSSRRGSPRTWCGWRVSAGGPCAWPGCRRARWMPVALAGGCAHIPAVQRAIAAAFGRAAGEPDRPRTGGAGRLRRGDAGRDRAGPGGRGGAGCHAVSVGHRRLQRALSGRGGGVQHGGARAARRSRPPGRAARGLPAHLLHPPARPDRDDPAGAAVSRPAHRAGLGQRDAL